MSLTPLGTRAMRERMLAEGREAGLVGELAGATPAELLGTVAEHYTASSAPEEIAIWRAAQGGSLDPLVQAVRDCPFLSRRVGLLQTLASSVPEGTELLAELIHDPDLGPVVLLADRENRRPQDASPDEAAWIMAGSLLELLEIGGPEAVREQLEGLPPPQRKDIVRAVSASSYPAPETLEEFRTWSPSLSCTRRPGRMPSKAPPRGVPGQGNRTGGNTLRRGFNERATPQSTHGRVTAMAGGAFEETLAGFRRWAGTTECKLTGDPEEDAAELYTLFGLMPDYLGIDTPSRLTAGLLNDLLLDVYPRKVTVLDRKDIASTIPALRDLTSYLADTGSVTATTARAMDRELDEIEPDFADAVMDPANWGPATAMMHAMHRDGVDISDSASVDTWIAQQNADVFAAHGADPLTWDGVDLKEAFGIPDVVAPVRLPDDEALTALAVAVPLLADLRGLTRDVRETPVRADGVDPLLLGLAVEAELVERDGDTLVPGEDVEWLDDLTEGAAALDAWDYAFAQVLDTTLEAAGQAEPQVGVDLAGHGIALVTELFLGGRAGIPVPQLSQSLKSAAIAEVPPDAADRQWEKWTGAHGDPAGLLLGQLSKLSAVIVDGGVARLEPLALHAVAAKLRACDVHVPDLPPTGEMTADDVMLLSMFGTEEDFAADFDSWVAERTPEDAARELLAFAAGEGAAVRTAAVQVVSRLGDAAEPALREALDRSQLRCYAKMALIERLADRDPEQPVPAELKRTTEDLAWFIADSFAPLTRTIDRNATFPFDMAQFSDAGWDVSNEALFDAVARLDHPDAEAVLTMLGKHCDDRKTAKAARKAAFKAASHRASCRS